MRSERKWVQGRSPVAGGGPRRRATRIDEAQSCLPIDVGESASVRPAREPTDDRAENPLLRHRLDSDVLGSLGWPEGTELLFEPGRTPQRGQVVLAVDGSRVRVGVFELQLGRAALRTDHGSFWIGRTDQVLGVLTVAGAPLPQP